MTNSEAIKILEMERIFRNGSNSKAEAIDIAISALEENTKLKAEIEQLKWKLSSVETQRDLKGYDAKRNVDIMSSQLKIIEQLKSELEQSVIPCTHGYDKRQNEIGETLIFCEYTDNWMNVTLGNCLGNCEEEQHLKGKVEE